MKRLIRPATWVTAAVSSVVAETETARTLTLAVPGWDGHVAGQHLDLRLTAEDGYQATRSYSISSGPGESPQITVERVDDGEVSPYLVDVAKDGDRFEVRGPLGGYFVWHGDDRPLVLIGGGSGIAPLRAMWRTRGAREVRLLYSARSASRVIFADEVMRTGNLRATVHLTRQERPGYMHGRVDKTAVEGVLHGADDPAVFICGPTGFVESVAGDAAELLKDGHDIRTERFG